MDSEVEWIGYDVYHGQLLTKGRPQIVTVGSNPAPIKSLWPE